MDIDFWEKRFERRNKEFKRDIDLFIFMMAWGIPLACWCIAQVIKKVVLR